MIDWKKHSESIIGFGEKVASGQFEGQLNIKVNPSLVKCIFDDYTMYFSNDGVTMLPTVEKATSLEEENAKLKAIIKELHEKVDSKNRIINRLQNDSWDDITYDRDR